ncbi:ETS-related transcription factor Elf-2-like [Sinocyclocheilus anshuiensis]|uniref:ETS-related transcription factor Elf-2-like n=1 Tax=Sinocyclocheilus anshuiensis TaxID=1608454 RepID=UPI0007BA31A3|nr:PREDICTED: ETS-related transcription factor Elf-2-like [Sinocyclocheilus anshuiensis]
MTSVVIVDGGGNILEYVAGDEEAQQEVCPDGVEADGEKACPAVIVEQVNSADVEQCYAAQVLVYDDQNTYLVQDVAEEQVVETELQEMAAVEVSVYDKTIEAAEALLHMDSPASLQGDRSTEELFSEVEVEVRTEDMGPVAKDIVVLQETDLLKKKKRGEPRFTQYHELQICLCCNFGWGNVFHMALLWLKFYILKSHPSQCFFVVSRTVRFAMQVPVLMTTRGQKISTVTVNSPIVRSPILPASNSVAGGNSAGKVVLQAVPTLVPAQGQSGERITLQLITLPTMPGKPGTPITLSTLSPVTVSTSNTQVLKLAVPSNISTTASTAPVTVVTSQPGVTVVPNAQPAMSLQDVTIIKVETPEVSVDHTVNMAVENTPSTEMNPTTTLS